MSQDLGQLAGLQFQLLATDLRNSARRTVWPVVLCGGAAAVTFAGVTNLVTAFGAWVATSWQLPPEGGLAIAGVAGLAVAAVMGIVAARRLREASAPLTRSVQELAANVREVREAVAGGPTNRSSQE